MLWLYISGFFVSSWYVYMQRSFLMGVSICILLLLLYRYTSYSSPQSTSKTSPFECGFEPFSNMRRPFSMRFFILVVLFLIFDVETVLFFPALIKISITPYNLSVLVNLFILMVLLVGGLVYEWKNGMLDWTKS
uniref:NADH-ubiquinone oxidoreductase chain 3 n=1 Tax=Aegista diversifamilia TaxID=1545397 RepID=A0A0U2DVP4_AEGDI|nr:NADH dehydrogenase subunit 3 [Aegista diversifamilia]AKP55343.1 NADH dehydrogenase subunit 3 [Aegista diversifamilia]